MTQIDEFESRFKSAAKPVFHFEPVEIKKITIVIDQSGDHSRDYVEKIEKFLAVLNVGDNQIETTLVTGDKFSSVDKLLSILKEQEPDLVCTYRNLHTPATEFPFSLGVYVDVMTQATDIPILLLPHPASLKDGDNVLRNSDRVMVVTDHLAGDAQIVTYAALFTQPEGELTLAHVEDEKVYKRFVDIVSKIPSIDTDSAKETIKHQLLKEPQDYIESCRTGLSSETDLAIKVTASVSMGDHLSDYRAIIDKSEIDLLVLNTKDDDQLAMHGLAYPLSIEFRDLPLLLI